MAYNSSMSYPEAILTLRIDTTRPVEIDAFVGAFTSLAEEYRRNIKANHPGAGNDARIYVKEVRKGSVEVDLIPLMTSIVPLIITHMDQVLILEKFVQTWGQRITALAQGRLGDWSPEKSELKVIADATEAIARDPDASSTLQCVTFEDKRRNTRTEFKFSTPEARKVQNTIDATYRELEKSDYSDHERVLMVFTRTDIGNAKLGKKSGEKVKIKEVHEKPLSLMYASELAEERLKHEIREAEDNVYKKGFVVDVTVKNVNGKPSVFAVNNVHDVIDLPED